MSSQNKIADIAVIGPGRFSDVKYSYAIPNKLINKININDIVEIPFRKKVVNGLIINIKKKKSEDIKYIKEINKKIASVDPKYIKFINEISNKYINPLGHTLYQYFKDDMTEDIKINNSSNISKNIYISLKDCSDELLNNINNDNLNIIFAPSLKSIEYLNDLIVQKGFNVSYYQKSGGNIEKKLLNKIIKDKQKGIFIALNTLIFNYINVKHLTINHYWDCNNNKYTEQRMPNFNLIDVANVKSKYFNSNNYYYSEFPNLAFSNYPSTLEIKINTSNVKYFPETNIQNSIQSFIEYSKDKDHNSIIYNSNFCSKNISELFIKEILKTKYSFESYSETTVSNSLHVLLEPSISKNSIVNSDQLSKLIRYLYNLQDFDKDLHIITTNNEPILNKININNVSKWLKEELVYRNKYGPSLDTKVIEITLDSLSDPLSNHIELQGPLMNDENDTQYIYQHTVTPEMAYNTNYFELLKKYNYRLINYL